MPGNGFWGTLPKKGFCAVPTVVPPCSPRDEDEPVPPAENKEEEEDENKEVDELNDDGAEFRLVV